MNGAFNYIAISMFHDREILWIGIMLMQKVMGVNRVYEWDDGIYIQIKSLDANSQLYGLELISETNETGLVGPNYIDKEWSRNGDIYHINLDFNFLREQKWERITQTNLLIISDIEKVEYGDRGDQFNPDFVNSAAGNI